MAKIHLETFINAPVERVFDLSRSIELHKLSTKKTNEEAVAGKTTGIIGLHETVTWRAKHLGVYQHLTVEIVAYERPRMFADRMLKGAFKYMHHEHLFEEQTSGTKMTDVFEFAAPLGLLGTLAEIVFLKAYMKRFLVLRNHEIKTIAESDQWKDLLKS